MHEWRSFALVGRWDLIDIESLIADAADDPNGEDELEELRSLLEQVVPLPHDDTAHDDKNRKRVADDGDAEKDDRSHLRKFVREGRYDRALQDVAKELRERHPRLCEPEDVEDGPVQNVDRKLDLVQQAADVLDTLEIHLDHPVDAEPDDRWLEHLERSATKALRDAGIDFRGLDDTHVAREDSDHRWRQVAHDAPEAFPLREVIDRQASDRRSHVWRAVRLLEEIEEIRKWLAPIPDASGSETGIEGDAAWSDRDMRVQSNGVGEAALRAGLLLAALDARAMEQAALRHRAVSDWASAGGNARSAKFDDKRSCVYENMDSLILRGFSERAAAQKLREMFEHIGMSAGAIRKMYRRERERR